jgi:catechol 2,3-dioxygenase-like lactoylglutathione lyase family enzyme
LIKPIIDHIDITVGDFMAAQRFYDAVLPLLGFDLARKRVEYEEADDYLQAEYYCDGFIFSIVRAAPESEGTAAAAASPGALHHLAFRARSKAEVDCFYKQFIKKLGVGAQTEPPALCPQYAPDYYAVFFCDPSGIRYELAYYSRAAAE